MHDLFWRNAAVRERPVVDLDTVVDEELLLVCWFAYANNVGNAAVF